MSIDRLAAAAWGRDAPATARRQVQSRVGALRRALGSAGAPDTIGTTRAGYRVRIEPDQLDALMFEDLVRTAGALVERGDRTGAARILRQALGLWRGPALGGLAGDELAGDVGELDSGGCSRGSGALSWSSPSCTRCGSSGCRIGGGTPRTR